MNVLFLAGGAQEPATRFRFAQFFPHFERRGVRCTLRSAYGALYNRLHLTPVAPVYKLACKLKRAALTVVEPARYDLVVLQRTAIPTTALPERLGARLNPHVVFDFDDAIFLGMDGEVSPRRQRAFKEAVALSTRVVAGNAHLAHCAGAPDKTTVIPTVIDTDRYVPPAGPRRADAEDIVIGWMGTSGHFEYFDAFIPHLARILAEYPRVRFRLVANATCGALEGLPRVEQVRWTEERELAELQSFDVGVMPLVDNPWTRGKCGFKMIQYMAVGSPVIASAVGANVEILRGSGAGLLVEEPAAWYTAMRRLIEDPALRSGTGAAARRHAVAHYSVASVIDRYLAVFRSAARPNRES